MLYSDNYRRIQNKNTYPCRIFETFEYYFKPYKVIRKRNYHGQMIYAFDIGKAYKTPTSFFGWRLVL